MKSYLIDSDVLIDFFKKFPEAVRLIPDLGEQGKIAISVISVTELRSGWTHEEAAIYLPILYDIFEIIPVSREIAEMAGECRKRYAGKSIKLSTIDMLIAATAMIDRSILVTRNIKHFPVSDVDIYQNIYR